MYKPIIIILNSPKGSGKDHIADELCYKYDVIKKEFKQPLYEICSSISGIKLEEFIETATDREKKETPLDVLGYLSPRQYMIKVSEEVIKPCFGKDYFGKRASKSIRDSLDFVSSDEFLRKNTPNKTVQFFIFSDGGFSKETIPMVEEFGCDSVKVVHLKREGCDFEGDSRRYLYPHDFPEGVCPYYFTEVRNEEGNPKKAIDEIKAIMQNCIADQETLTKGDNQ